MIVAIFLSVFVVCLQKVVALSWASSTIWSTVPATKFTSGYPVGSGRLGATVFGGIAQETVVLNEESVWNGGREDRVNPDALTGYADVVADMNAGHISDANSVWVSKMASNPSQERAYQPVGNMIVSFHQSSSVSSYNRSLDLLTSLNEVSYTAGGTKYTRQAMANYPLGVIGFRYTTDVAGALSLDISLQRAQGLQSVTANLSQRSITLRGRDTTDNLLNFTAQLRVVTNSGTVTVNSTSISIQNSQDVQVYFDAETAFRYSSQANWEQAMNSKLDAAVAAGWTSFYASAVSDYQSLASRVSLDLGDSGSAGRLETPTRLTNFKANGNVTSDPEYLALAFNFGRFLLIGSSRPGTLPANLQGVWNADFDPAWGSKFTININTEMNYWSAETTNLAETHEALFDHILRMQVTGQDIAKRMYGLTGWLCHHNTDLWADCAPQGVYTQSAPNTLGGAWISQHLIEHYRFSGNKTFATNVALPIIKDALTFFYGFLILKPDGYYVGGYGASPENAYIIPSGKTVAGGQAGIDQGCAHERQVLYELLKGFIELSQATGETDGVSTAQAYLSKIKPPTIGSLGQVLEWSGEYKETDVGNRHLSHMVAVWPGSQISPLLNTTLSNAALVAINRRMNAGSGNVGWSRAWAAGIYARLLEADTAMYHLCYLVMNKFGGNLFDLYGANFQIDANLGMVAALTEILLQSHTGVVHLLPALTSNSLPTGSVSGLRARGGFLVSLTWSGHALTNATVISQNGGMLALRVQNGKAFTVDGVSYTGAISTKVGQSYSIAL